NRSRARSGSSTTARIMALSVVSRTMRARTCMPFVLNRRIKSCRRPSRLGVKTENWITGSARRDLVVCIAAIHYLDQHRLNQRNAHLIGFGWDFARIFGVPEGPVAARAEATSI